MVALVGAFSGSGMGRRLALGDSFESRYFCHGREESGTASLAVGVEQITSGDGVVVHGQAGSKLSTFPGPTLSEDRRGQDCSKNHRAGRPGSVVSESHPIAAIALSTCHSQTSAPPLPCSRSASVGPPWTTPPQSCQRSPTGPTQPTPRAHRRRSTRPIAPLLTTNDFDDHI